MNSFHYFSSPSIAESLSINLNPALGSATYQNLLLLVLLQAVKSSHALRMLTGLVEYLQRLGMKVVCEGVENQTHIEIADQLGCDYQQGYVYAMPSPLSRWA